jgi:hypothetical protein
MAEQIGGIPHKATTTAVRLIFNEPMSLSARDISITPAKGTDQAIGDALLDPQTLTADGPGSSNNNWTVNVEVKRPGAMVVNVNDNLAYGLTLYMAAFAVSPISDSQGKTVRLKITFSPGYEPTEFLLAQVQLIDVVGGADIPANGGFEKDGSTYTFPVSVRRGGEIGVFISSIGVETVVPVTVSGELAPRQVTNKVSAAYVHLNSGLLTMAANQGWETTGTTLDAEVGSRVFVRVYPAMEDGVMLTDSFKVTPEDVHAAGTLDLKNLSGSGGYPGTGYDKGSVWSFIMPDCEVTLEADFEPKLGAGTNAIVLVSTGTGIPQGTTWWPLSAKKDEVVAVELHLHDDTEAAIDLDDTRVAALSPGAGTHVAGWIYDKGTSIVSGTMPDASVEMDAKFVLTGDAWTPPGEI